MRFCDKNVQHLCAHKYVILKCKISSFQIYEEISKCKINELMCACASSHILKIGAELVTIVCASLEMHA